ncbi:hypothetical protein AVEN_204162-1 [Araneus ventricosus]|uniref:Uncharacterized protein n=1 Tax=Araneus ventricosus TaxID=182803 RepID=A0A4Y2MKS1_ARAVE|nr:hypothetical protein AVEN_204162-1 [Araneus ventricosus]
MTCDFNSKAWPTRRAVVIRLYGRSSVFLHYAVCQSLEVIDTVRKPQRMDLCLLCDGEKMAFVSDSDIASSPPPTFFGHDFWTVLHQSQKQPERHSKKRKSFMPDFNSQY